MNRDPSIRWPALILAFPTTCALVGATEPSCLSEGLPEGINDQYLSRDLDPGKDVEHFESESRELYSRRHAIVSALRVSRGQTSC